MKNRLLVSCGLLTALFFLLTSTSCSRRETRVVMQASADAKRHYYNGPSYQSQAADDYSFGVNVGAFLLFELCEFLDDIGHIFGNSRSSAVAAAPDELPKPSPWRAMTGLELIQKGSKNTAGGGKTEDNLLYAVVPFYALYTYEVPKGGTLFGGLGPYLGYGLTGTFKSTFNGQTFKTNAFDKNNGGFKRFDAGLGFVVGYQLPSELRLSLGYQLGLTNLEHDKIDKTKNRTLSFNVGYPLDKLIRKKAQ